MNHRLRVFERGITNYRNRSDPVEKLVSWPGKGRSQGTHDQ